MLRKKFYKILSVLVVIIITSFLFIIPASAATTDTAFLDLFLKMANIYVLDENDNLVDDVDFAIKSTGATIEGLGKCVTVSLSRSSYEIGFTKGDYTLIVQFEADDYLLSKTNYVVGGFSLLCGNQYSINPLLDSSYFYAYRIPLTTETGPIEEQYGSIEWSVYSNTNRYRIDFSRNELGKIYHKYVVSMPFRINSNETDSIGLFMCDFDLRLLSPDEAAAQDIIDNENSNTDKIINGWSPDNQLDTKTFDDYKAQEDKILSDTAQGRSEAVSLFNNFHFDANLQQGLYCATAIITDFVGNLDSSWLHSLLKISLIIGIFGFVIGTVQIVASHFGSNSRSPRSYFHYHFHSRGGLKK